MHQLKWLYFATANSIASYAAGILFAYVIVNKLTVKSKLGLQLILAATIFAFYISPRITELEEVAHFEMAGISVDLKPLISQLEKMVIVLAYLGGFYLAWNEHFDFIGKQGLVNWRLFEIAGKISYSSFMVHYLIIWYRNATERHMNEFIWLDLFNLVVAIVTLSHILGYFLYILVEAPASNLLRLLLKK